MKKYLWQIPELESKRNYFQTQEILGRTYFL
jgi:hypothetical protein